MSVSVRGLHSAAPGSLFRSADSVARQPRLTCLRFRLISGLERTAPRLDRRVSTSHGTCGARRLALPPLPVWLELSSGPRPPRVPQDFGPRASQTPSVTGVQKPVLMVAVGDRGSGYGPRRVPRSGGPRGRMRPPAACRWSGRRPPGGCGRTGVVGGGQQRVPRRRFGRAGAVSGAGGGPDDGQVGGASRGCGASASTSSARGP